MQVTFGIVGFISILADLKFLRIGFAQTGEVLRGVAHGPTVAIHDHQSQRAEKTTWMQDSIGAKGLIYRGGKEYKDPL